MKIVDPNRPPEKDWPAPAKPEKPGPNLKLGANSPRARTKTSPPIRAQLASGPREFSRLNPPNSSTASRPLDSDVKGLLRQNVRRENLFKRVENSRSSGNRSSRGRDYFLGLLIGNLTLGGIYLFLPQNVVSFLFIAGGMAVYSVGFSWLMFSVSDDY